MPVVLPQVGPNVIETVDATATTSTSYALSVGQTARGIIGTSGDHDYYKVDLVAGQTYTIAIVGTGSANLLNPFLRLTSADGTTVVASNDNGLQNRNSMVTFTATASGTYFIDASAAGTGTGQYGIALTEGTKASFNLEMTAGIIDTHATWSPVRGTGVVVTYGFRDTDPAGHTNFTHFSEEQKAATRAILQLYSEVSGIVFQEVNPGGYTDNATILLANYSAADGTGGHASYPGSTTATSSAGDIWMNTAPIETPLQFGSYAMYALMHEIGHAIGLSHPGVYNAGSGGSISYALSAQFVQDSNQYSIMSYWGASNTGSNLGGYGDTPMLADVMALQSIYGTNMTTRTGDTVYGFGSNVGSVYDFSTNSRPALALWDAGGNDTLNASRYSANQFIDLNAGMFSNIGGLTANIAIVPGATIENAFGGRGSDTINGNAAANVLHGMDGRDRLDGGEGADTLYGGLHNDVIVGGSGSDTLYGEGEGGNGYAARYGLTMNAGGTTGQSLRQTNLTGLPQTQVTLEFDISFATQPTSARTFVRLPGLSVMIDPTNTGAPGVWIFVNGSATYTGISAAQLSDGATHHISFTWDSATGTFAHYLDGVLVKTGAGHQTGANLNATGTGTMTVDPTNATIGDVRLYNRALTANEVYDTSVATLSDPVNATGLLLNWQVAANGTVSDAHGGAAPVVAGSPTAATLYAATTFDDMLDGGAGDDWLIGGRGNDSVEGGTGVDTVDYSGDAAAGGTTAIGVYLQYNGATDGFGHFDTVTNVENAVGTDVANAGYNDIFAMNDVANVVDARDGGDVVYTYGGDDVVVGGLGIDWIFGGDGNDVIVGSNFTAGYTGEIDYLYGDAGNDTIVVGYAGTGYIVGGSGNDTIFGGYGADYVQSGSGNDYIYMLEGTDVALVYASELIVGDTDFYLDFLDGQDYIYMSASLAGSTSFGNSNGYGYMAVTAGGGTHYSFFQWVTGAQLQDQVFYYL